MKYSILWNKFIDAFMELFIRRLFSFKGRASRKEYIIRTITLFILCVLILPIDQFYDEHSSLFLAWCRLFIYDAILIIYILQYFFLAIRRLHDLNASGWWQLITFIPLGQLLMIAFIFYKGTSGPNKYGEQSE